MTPTIQVNESSVEDGVAEGSSVQDIIDLVQSQHVAHGEVIGSIYINGERCTELDRTIRLQDGLHGKYLIMRRGKKKYTLIS